MSENACQKMRPVLFSVDGVPIYAYGLFFLLAILTVLALVLYEARRRRWPKEEVVPILLAAFVGGMVGARVSILFFTTVGRHGPKSSTLRRCSTRGSALVRSWAESAVRTSAATSPAGPSAKTAAPAARSRPPLRWATLSGELASSWPASTALASPPTCPVV